MTIIYFMLLLGVIITIHELGHLISAKIFGVYCYEFSFGMGPVLLKKQGKETQYSLRAIPIGGFVAMAGETEDNETYGDIEVPEDRRLNNKPVWQRLIVLLAGVTMNFILAWLIYSLVFLSYGEYAIAPEAIIGTVGENTPAEAAGFEVGDKIIRIEAPDGTYIEPKTFSDMQTFLYGEGVEETYTVLRGDETVTLTVTPKLDEETGRYLIGIQSIEPTIVKVNLLNCWKYGASEFVDMARMMFTTLKSLFRGHGLDQLSGPVGIYQAAGTYASYGFIIFIQLVAMLSLNVGIFNLLPLPVLDGGQVVIVLVEAILRRPLSEKLKTAVMAICWVLLLGLMVYVTWNDISRLLS